MANFDITMNNLLLSLLDVQSLFHSLSNDRFSPWGFSNVSMAVFQQVKFVDVAELRYLCPVEFGLGWI